MAKKSDAPKKTVLIDGDKKAKAQALSDAIAKVVKDFGDGAVMYMNGNNKLNVEATPTGSLTLDLALGIGGLPKGRIIEIYGPESGGKTTVSLHAVAEAQRRGGICVFVDVEHAFDPSYAKNLGVDLDNLLVSQPDTGEQALEIIETLVRSGSIDVVVLDSVAAMTTRAEIEGNMGDATVGLQARLMSSAMRKLTAIIGKTNTVAIFINQVREKIGISYGNPEVTPGGRALKFYSSVRIEVRKGKKIEEKGEVIGTRTICKVSKNKVAPPFKTAEFDMIYGKGISKTGEILDLAEELDIVKKSGAWFSYEGEKIGQGREKSKEFLDREVSIRDEIEKKVRENGAAIGFAVGSEDDESSARPKTFVEGENGFEEFSPDEI